MRYVRYPIFYRHEINGDKKTSTFTYAIYNEKGILLYEGSFIKKNVYMDFKRGWRWKKVGLVAGCIEAAERHGLALKWFHEAVYVTSDSAKLNVDINETDYLFVKRKTDILCSQLKPSSRSYAERVSSLINSTRTRRSLRKANIFVDYDYYIR